MSSSSPILRHCGGGVSQLLTKADKGGGGGSQKLTFADRGGGVYEPPFLADEICEQPLSIIKHEYILTWSYIKNNVCTFYSMRALDHANCSQKLTRGEGGSAKSLHLLTEGGGVYEPPFLADVICEQPLRKYSFLSL